MKQVSGKDFAKAIVRKGWALSRVRGSHHIYVMEGRRERIVIPIHGSQPLKIGLLRNLMEIADFTEGEL